MDYPEVLGFTCKSAKLIFYQSLGREFTDDERERRYVKQSHCVKGNSYCMKALSVHMEVTRSNEFKSSKVVHYGNEADGIDCLYKYICLTVAIGPVDDRTGADPDGYDEGRWRIRDDYEDYSSE